MPIEKLLEKIYYMKMRSNSDVQNPVSMILI